MTKLNRNDRMIFETDKKSKKEETAFQTVS
ncbi:Uncharacterised protein [Chryseobacterium indoltheticum]|uniref:Uncharacterized protein n=1 Tax=Chryseobacterium indoltheticum TaxID=254 RepID=A0A381FFQ8_9FLAO|nr:Uncharacterised protein [Chryseobacterium indoltheticum]